MENVRSYDNLLQTLHSKLVLNMQGKLLLHITMALMLRGILTANQKHRHIQ